MTRFERWAVWSTTLLTAATGFGFFWTKYLVTPKDPFSVIHHPMEPVFLKLHILVAPLFLFAIGIVFLRHIWKHFRSGTRRSRRTGITTALTIAPMVATGYLIQVLTSEGWLRAMALAHIGFGTLYLVGIALHRWLLRRSVEKAVERTVERADTAGPPPAPAVRAVRRGAYAGATHPPGLKSRERTTC